VGWACIARYHLALSTPKQANCQGAGMQVLDPGTVRSQIADHRAAGMELLSWEESQVLLAPPAHPLDEHCQALMPARQEGWQRLSRLCTSRRHTHTQLILWVGRWVVGCG